MKSSLTARIGRSSWAVVPLVCGLFVVSTVPGNAAPGSESAACCAAQHATNSSNAPVKAAPQDLASRWGIEVTAVRLSANGNLIDFRYRVLDPQKAAILGSLKIKPELIDQDTGARLHVPSMPKVGQLRSTTQRLIAGRIYTALFSNPGGAVKQGHKVTIVFGDFRAENLTVEG